MAAGSAVFASGVVVAFLHNGLPNTAVVTGVIAVVAIIYLLKPDHSKTANSGVIDSSCDL